MAWNDSGNNNKNPWGNNKKNQSELDDFLKGIIESIKNLFGNKTPNNLDPSSKKNLGLIGIGIFAIYLLSGIYIVNDGERGVVLQFGKFREITAPGPHWLPHFIQAVEVVDVAKIRSTQQRAVMLTEDENIVSINFAIQYDVKDASNFIFNLRDPDTTLRQAGESAIREVLGKNKMDYIITEGREAVATTTQILLQSILDFYKSGINVQTVNILEAQPPEQVQDAFSDAIKAREDEQRYINEAEAYKNEIIPLARGEAKQIVEEAKAYRVKLIKSAEGEATRFRQLYTEYQKAPQVTRERLYLEAVESVFENTSKVMIDVDKGNNLMYLPLDKIINSNTTNNENNTSRNQGSQNPFSEKLKLDKNTFDPRKRKKYE